MLASVFGVNASAADYDLIISHTINQNSPEQRAYTYFKDLIEEKSELLNAAVEKVTGAKN